MTEPGKTVIAGRGPTVEITPEHQKAGHKRFDEKLALAQRTGDHFWVAIVYYAVDPTQKPFHLDQENIGGAPMLICYRCEELYDPKLAQRRCKGDVPIG